MDNKVSQTKDATRTVKSLETEVLRLQRMVNISQLLNSTLDLTRLLDTIVNTAAELLATQDASIMLVEQRTGELFFAASKGMSREEIRQIKVPIEGSIAGAIYKTGEPIITGDVSTDDRHYAGVDQSIKSINFKTQSLLVEQTKIKVCSRPVHPCVNHLGITGDGLVDQSPCLKIHGLGN